MHKVSKRPRLAILCTHPIQYYAPVFRKLSSVGELDLKVFYGWRGTADAVDPGFERRVDWDIPLLDGYDFEFVPNTSRSPGTDRFHGIDLPTLHDRIDAWNATSLLIYGWNYRAHLKAMRRYKNKIPVFFRGDSTLIDEKFGPKQWARRWWLRWVYRHIDVALAVGSNNRKYFEVHGVPESRITLVPHSVDNDRFGMHDRENQETADQVRHSLGISDSEIVILFVGKLEQTKAPDILLDSFSALGRTGNHLVFVGSGRMERELRACNIRNVHFLGFQNQSVMPVMYRIGDVSVLPSFGETWGLALNEAMACKRAVIASDRVGAAVDLIQANDNGWVFTAGNVDSLRNVLEHTVRLGRRGLREIGEVSGRRIQLWSMDVQVSAMDRAIREWGSVNRC